MSTLPLQHIKAAIFDMDGTMINNMAYHQKAWGEFCRRHGILMNDHEFRHKISGKKNDQIFSLLFNAQLTAEQQAGYTAEKEAIYRELYAPDIRAVDGLDQIITELHNIGLKLGIATTSPIANRSFVLPALGLDASFDTILGEEDVTKGKPDPEIYLLAAQHLNVNPSDCIVFEDSPPGVQAGKTAGMYVVGLLTTHTKEELALADICVNDFNELELQPNA
jgi:beta-phosphoglucomutase family hydrolase